MLKSQIHIFTGVESGGEGCPKMANFCRCAESKNSKIPNSHFCRCARKAEDGVGGQLSQVMLSPVQNAKITNSHFHRWKRGIESQLLMLSP